MNVASAAAEDAATVATNLSLQLAVAAGFVVLLVAVHSLGLVGISRVLRLEEDRLLKHEFNFRAIGLLSGFGLLLFALHIAEIVIFAGFYRLIGALPSMREALVHSAAAYVTLGLTADTFPVEWELIVALEALIGFVLIGWSTAFMVSTMRDLTR